jgi:hypothetical protein
MTVREKKTVQYGAMAAVLYLLLFFGVKAWKNASAESRGPGMQAGGQGLKQDFERYETKRQLYEKLHQQFRIDPATLDRKTIIADASAAIQNTAKSGGVNLGPLRESSARASAKELATMQLEGVGPVTSVMKFLHEITSLGYPIVIDSLQLNPDPSGPGHIKVNLSIVVLDYEQWKKGPNA